MKPWPVFPFCLLLVSAVVAQTPAAKPPASCTVQGQIIQQPGGQPIRKANISLSTAGASDDASEFSAVTDAEGHFN